LLFKVGCNKKVFIKLLALIFRSYIAARQQTAGKYWAAA